MEDDEPNNSGASCTTIPERGPGRPKAFAAATAEVTGESKQSIDQYRAIGDALGEDALRVGGTSLDKKAELTALAKMPAEQRAPLIARAVAGEKVTARAPTVAQAIAPHAAPGHAGADRPKRHAPTICAVPLSQLPNGGDTFLFVGIFDGTF